MKLHFLTLKIPPVALVIIVALLIYVTSLALGGAVELTLYRQVGIAVTTILAVYFCVAGVWEFKKAKTTVNPMSPESSSQLVNSGVYRFSRNPMYLGFVLCLITLVTYCGHTLSIIYIPAFMLYMNRFQISAEEEALLSLFGEPYTHYLNSVRRWL